MTLHRLFWFVLFNNYLLLNCECTKLAHFNKLFLKIRKIELVLKFESIITPIRRLKSKNCLTTRSQEPYIYLYTPTSFWWGIHFNINLPYLQILQWTLACNNFAMKRVNISWHDKSGHFFVQSFLFLWKKLKNQIKTTSILICNI